MNNRKLGSIALARSLCYQINGAADDSDDIDGGGYGSVDVAEILSAEIERLREALAQPEQEPLKLMRAAVANDAWAISFQSLGQYRTALLKLIDTTPPEAQPEPVAFYHPHKGFYWAKPTHISAPTVVDVPPVPLYVKWKAAQRPWQGLTEEDWEEIDSRKETVLDTFAQGAVWAQQRLRERNT
jgi:hypothetical protein